MGSVAVETPDESVCKVTWRGYAAPSDDFTSSESAILSDEFRDRYRQEHDRLLVVLLLQLLLRAASHLIYLAVFPEALP